METNKIRASYGKTGKQFQQGWAKNGEAKGKFRLYVG